MEWPTATLGPKANRFFTGVLDDSYHVDLLSDKDLSTIRKFVCKMEQLRDMWLPHHVIHDALEAMKLLGWKTLGKGLTSHGFSITRNVQFRVHTEDDLTYCTVVVLKKDHVCSLNDDVAAYFCFSRLGLTVPMRPGDAVVFNLQEPRCLSSRCNSSDSIYGIAIFTKSRVAGGNDNGLQTTDVQEFLSGKYEDK